ncbi:MAG TPA: hypothetical protein VGD27_07365 [Longimicrobiales bacterium]
MLTALHEAEHLPEGATYRALDVTAGEPFLVGLRPKLTAVGIAAFEIRGGRLLFELLGVGQRDLRGKGFEPEGPSEILLTARECNRAFPDADCRLESVNYVSGAATK